MADVPVRVLNQETAKVLARVKAGEEIIVTERGAVIARIVPASAGPLDDLVGAGRVRPATVRGHAPRPKARAEGGVEHELGEHLRVVRDEERY
ncbi:MAG: type II toxin-antitoxin system prevent-host-death family antitoxin [Mycobacterium sp.]|nr:type II toxin-antitoxin system prevent-host-death family antitoxin [Mycobacterium sp.]